MGDDAPRDGVPVRHRDGGSSRRASLADRGSERAASAEPPAPFPPPPSPPRSRRSPSFEPTQRLLRSIPSAGARTSRSRVLQSGVEARAQHQPRRNGRRTSARRDTRGWNTASTLERASRRVNGTSVACVLYIYRSARAQLPRRLHRCEAAARSAPHEAAAASLHRLPS